MWPSLETASRVQSLANIFLVVSLTVGAISTLFTIWMGNVKEEYLKQSLAPRSLSQLQSDNLNEKLKPFSGIRVDIIVYPQGSADITPLSSQLSAVLQKANWNLKLFTAMGANTICTGVVIQTKVEANNNIELAANSLIEGLNTAGILAGKLESFSDNEIPGGGVFGAIWAKDDVAPIRISIGNKP